jgi:hypothetical protein
VLLIRIGFNADPDTAFCISTRARIQIHETKPLRLHADPDSGQALKSQKVEFLHEKYTEGQESHLRSYKSLLKGRNQVPLKILVNFHAPGSGSAFPIRIRIQDSRMNADPHPQYSDKPTKVLGTF